MKPRSCGLACFVPALVGETAESLVLPLVNVVPGHADALTRNTLGACIIVVRRRAARENGAEGEKAEEKNGEALHKKN